MLAVKFRRVGKKHQASFQVVVVEKRSKIDGRFIEKVGWLDPHQKKFDLKKERINYWLGVGAQPTDSVHNLLVKAGIFKEAKIPVHSTVKKEKKVDEAEAGKPASAPSLTLRATTDKPVSDSADADAKIVADKETTADKSPAADKEEAKASITETQPEKENKPDTENKATEKPEKTEKKEAKSS